MDNKIKEYEMLRQEILQYLGEYQTVRNMMYLITVTLLGFCLTGENTIVYAYLLPLVVIFPSYMIAMDYWKDVCIASTYLRVFHEEEKGYPIQWETRRSGKFNNNIMIKTDFPSLSYKLCYIACIILYFFNIKYPIIIISDAYEEFIIFRQKYVFGCWSEIFIGVMACIIGIFVFIRYQTIDSDKFIEEWKRIKEKEEAEKNSQL